MIRDIFHTLERAYGKSVLVEFTAMLDLTDSRDIDFRIKIQVGFKDDYTGSIHLL